MSIVESRRVNMQQHLSTFRLDIIPSLDHEKKTVENNLLVPLGGVGLHADSEMQHVACLVWDLPTVPACGIPYGHT